VLLKHQEQTLDQKIWEFDFWVTPSIVDIRATDRFKLEMRRVLGVLDALTVGGHKELDSKRYAADLVDRAIVHLKLYDAKKHAPYSPKEYSEEFLASLAALLFLVTGKSDNNNKCQFPIYLKAQAGWGSLPTLKSRGKKKVLAEEDIPRIIDSEAYMARVARMHVASMDSDSDPLLQGVASKLLFQFVNSLLGDDSSRDQLTAYLRHYSSSLVEKKDPAVLLTPLVMFQVRGSVAASGGHEPEEILRGRMTDWGMIRAVDFNTKDVILDSEAGAIFEERGEELEEKRGKTKTRAYDFALPFRTPKWHPMIFVQSQFYAGDSGSVSHKNVDQTSSSRSNATKLSIKAWPASPPPVFLEYVDGAGYSASLNADLKSLLSFADTAGFFQIRSASIRLRRELQKIGFLTPLEIGHAIFRAGSNSLSAKAHLNTEGYSNEEIGRAIGVALQHEFIEEKDDQLIIAKSFEPVVRHHLLLDIIACEGKSFPSLSGIAGVVLIPGYGPYYGLAIADLEKLISKSFRAIWPTGFMGDLQHLCESGTAVLR